VRGAELGLLIALDALLTDLNVTHAAARLHVTQPALSNQLSRLRKMFNDPLLIVADSGRGMTPTPRALELKTQLNELLRELRALVEHPPAFDPKVHNRDFSIAANDNAAMMIGIGLIGRVARVAGFNVRIALRNPQPASLPTQIERGEIDLVLGLDRSFGKELAVRHLFKDHFQVGQRKRHPRGAGSINAKAYCQYGHVIVSGDGGGFQTFIDSSLQNMGMTRHVAVSVQHYGLVPQILMQTDYLATLPARFLAAFTRQLDTCPPPVASNEFFLSAGWHPRNNADPGHRWLREQVIAVAEG
jgi:DNA-binding transcriptional LysR family regulator